MSYSINKTYQFKKNGPNITHTLVSGVCKYYQHHNYERIKQLKHKLKLKMRPTLNFCKFLNRITALL